MIQNAIIQINPNVYANRNIAKFFRPTWVGRGQTEGGGVERLSDKDVEQLVGAGQGLGRLLDLSRLDWDRNTAADTDNSAQSRLLQSFRASLPVSGLSLTSTSNPGPTPPPKRTYGRTYSRAGRGSKSAAVASPAGPAAPARDRLSLVPPCRATLLGLRGALLRAEYLQEPANHARTRGAERDSLERTVMLGIGGVGQPGPAAGTSENTGPAASSPGHLAADRLLVRRFLQLFLLPARLSQVAPPRQQELFSDCEEEQQEVGREAGQQEAEHLTPQAD